MGNKVLTTIRKWTSRPPARTSRPLADRFNVIKAEPLKPAEVKLNSRPSVTGPHGPPLGTHGLLRTDTILLLEPPKPTRLTSRPGDSHRSKVPPCMSKNQQSGHKRDAQ